MDTVTPVTSSVKCDPQIVKRWAAEHVAIAIGLLRECPYHGEPYKARKTARTRALASAIIDPRDPALSAFNGNTRELLATAERVARDYASSCSMCEASDHEEFD